VVRRPFVCGPGSDVVAASGERGLEGVIAKRLDSRYIPGSRSPLWIKLKHVRSQEVVIGGFTKGGGSRSGSIGALLLGVADLSGLRYVGKVGSGFDSEELRSLGTALSKIPAKVSPFSEVLPGPDRRAATWVQPTLVGEVSFAEWTAGGRLRQPVWKGL
jgi:bifunctional non-homologous end joining protein LigD